MGIGEVHSVKLEHGMLVGVGIGVLFCGDEMSLPPPRKSRKMGVRTSSFLTAMQPKGDNHP